MIEIFPATIADIPIIQTIASRAWPHTFKDILSDSQITYMMQLMYSDESLQKQIEDDNHRYFLAKQHGHPVGYISIEHNCNNSGKTKVHKVYLLPEKQQQGIGSLLFAVAESKAKEANDTAIFLNVNKENTNAIAFYLRVGYLQARAEMIDIGNGFVMDDFVFEKRI